MSKPTTTIRGTARWFPAMFFSEARSVDQAFEAWELVEQQEAILRQFDQSGASMLAVATWPNPHDDRLPALYLVLVRDGAGVVSAGAWLAYTQVTFPSKEGALAAVAHYTGPTWVALETEDDLPRRVN